MTVAPLTGAWIETQKPHMPNALQRSHPSRVRGLKPVGGGGKRTDPPSHPSRVRGLKHRREGGGAVRQESHPSRVRGLKQCLVPGDV